MKISSCILSPSYSEENSKEWFVEKMQELKNKKCKISNKTNTELRMG